jgi:hypothetical protein
MVQKILIISLFFVFIFLRFSDLSGRMQFTWDQVQNAWVMKDMLVDGRMPLEGMTAKLNSGIRIGPAYYYLLAPFYWAFDMDPLAAGVFAGFVAAATFICFSFILTQLFSFPVAFVGMLIYTFSSHIISHDRIPWPVIFLPLVSMLTLYYLMRLIAGHASYLPYLAVVLGASLHVHFTAIFLFAYVVLCLPFFVRVKHIGKYILWSIPLFCVWLIPMIIASSQGAHTPATFMSYAKEYSHGLHAIRVLQLVPDAVIEFGSVLRLGTLSWLKFFVIPVFAIVYLTLNRTMLARKFMYLFCIWFAVPLLVFALYKGEISDYYFAVTRPVVVLMYAYIVVQLFSRGNILVRTIVLILGAWLIFINLRAFVTTRFSNLPHMRDEVLRVVRTGGNIGFTEGDPKSYLYFLYKEYKN